MVKYSTRILRNTLFISLFTGYSFNLAAQETPVSFKIVNSKKEPVPLASVRVANSADTLRTTSKVADSLGTVTFDLLKGGQYFVTISSVNYQTLQKGIVITPGQRNFSFILESLPKTLGGVVVRSTRPLMRQEDDKTIVDPENLVASSTNGYEVIEKIPGVFVDQDGNIYINSTTPASILINGREMKMSTADIATLLKSLPPNSIASIEIVRTPSAKYDASGSGGVVNVVLKKGVKLGLTGSVHSGWQQATYGNEFIGLNLNNNNGETTTYLNLNYSRRNYFERLKTDRLFAPDSMLSQDAFTKYLSNSYYLGFGWSHQLHKKWEFSYDSRISLNQSNNKTDNPSVIKKISADEVLTDNLSRINNKGTSWNLNQGINAKLKIDTIGSEWTTDLSYTYAANPSRQYFTTYFNVPPLPLYGGDGDIDNERHFLTAQTDLSWKLPKKFTFETGLKTSLLNFNSNTDYFKENGGIRYKDFARTNTFRYNENINAVYLQGSKNILSDVILKLGTRLENTNMKGHQVFPGDTTFAIHRTDLFPYVYLSKKVMTIAGYDLRAYLVYRRTISRPVYEQLNPFPRYVDQYLSETGNPSLRPQFNINYEANISVDEMPLLAFGMNRTKDIFTNVIYQADSSQSQAYRTYDNLGTNKEFYVRGLGAIPPGHKYFFVVVGQYNHNFYQGLYENKPLSFKKGSWTFFTYHMLKIGSLSQVTLSGFIRLKGQLQFYELSSFGALNASINRQFIKKKLTVTLSANDLFYTNQNDFSIRQGSVNARGTRVADTRRFGINLRYNFGIRKKEENSNLFNVESPEKSN